MHLLLQQAVTLDHQLLASSSSPSTSAKQVSPSKPAKPLSIKAQSGSKHGHSKGASSKQAKQLAAEIADANENAQAKLAHDMALSLQLTRGVADEAAKLHHVKIIRAHSGQQPGSSNGAVGPSEEAVPSGEVCLSICLLLSLSSNCSNVVQTLLLNVGHLQWRGVRVCLFAQIRRLCVCQCSCAQSVVK